MECFIAVCIVKTGTHTGEYDNQGHMHVRGNTRLSTLGIRVYIPHMMFELSQAFSISFVQLRLIHRSRNYYNIPRD